jgi:hypothetical protein
MIWRSAKSSKPVYLVSTCHHNAKKILTATPTNSIKWEKEETGKGEREEAQKRRKLSIRIPATQT